MLVDIDTEQVTRDFDARLALLPPDALEGEVLGPDNAGTEEWVALVSGGLGLMKAQFFPLWTVPEDAQQGMSHALVELLTQLFPNGLVDIQRKGPVLRLLYYTGKAAMPNFDFETLWFKPRVEVPPETPQQQQKSEPQEEGVGYED